MSGSGAVGLGVGVGCYQPGVYVPLTALFLILKILLGALGIWLSIYIFLLKHRSCVNIRNASPRRF